MFQTLFKSIGSTCLLVQFWVRYLPLLHSLDPLLKDPEALERALTSRPDELRIPAPAQTAARYNQGFEQLRSQMRARFPAEVRVPFRAMMAAQFSLRLLLCLLAALGLPPPLLLAVSLGQFLIGPHSLFVNVAMTLALGTVLYFPHYLAVAAARHGLQQLLGPEFSMPFPLAAPVGWWFA